MSDDDLILNEDFNPQHIGYISTVLQRIGVLQLKVYFSGSGDSGGVEDWEIKGPKLDDLQAMPVSDEITTVYADAVDNDDKLAARYERSRWGGGKFANMYDWLSSWCRDYCGSEPYVNFDYYNNDGGGGTCTIFPGEMRWETEGYQYEQVRQEVGDEAGQADFSDFIIK